MQPDFAKKTIDVLAKRSAFKCSNPDCRVSTIGPNGDPEKSTSIGEAAHILGAREGAKRFSHNMTDAARAGIINAIWLCRNCHKLIDTDEQRFPSEVLFSWRENHESYVQLELGNSTDRIIKAQLDAELLPFAEYPPVVRRILTDKPVGWEYSLTAELMRHLNTPVFRKVKDLDEGLYIGSYEHIPEEQFFSWVGERLAELSNLTEPLVKLLDRLNESWGAPGEEGSADEVLHVCTLIHGHLENIVSYEEKIYFSIVEEKHEKVASLLKGILGCQLEKLASIPEDLDTVISMVGDDHEGTAEEPLVIHKTIDFDVPDNWEKEFNRELKKVAPKAENTGVTIFSVVFWVVFFGVVYIVAF